MKTAPIIILVLAAAFCGTLAQNATEPTAAAPEAATVTAAAAEAGTVTAADTGKLTISAAVDSLCTDIKEKLGGLENLGKLIKIAAEEEIELPAGSELIVAAPSDAAVASLLEKLDVESADKLEVADVKRILALHIGAAANEEADTATTVAGTEMTFTYDDNALALGEFTEFIGGKAFALITTGSNTVNATASVSCPGQTAMIIDNVLLPADLAETVAAAPSAEDGAASKFFGITIALVAAAVGAAMA